jgi:hypothetical protein
MSTVRSLSVASASAQLDVTDNHLVVDYTGASPITSIRQMLAAARIVSSTSDAPRRLGYLDDGSAVLIELARAGDGNLDGFVDATDLGLLAVSWQSGGAFWAGGDFDYSGFVDVNDLALLAMNWQAGGSLAQSVAALGLPTPAVPEPGALAGALCASAAVLTRRSRLSVPRASNSTARSSGVSPWSL